MKIVGIQLAMSFSANFLQIAFEWTMVVYM